MSNKFRYERKFIVPELCLDEIGELIKFHPSMFHKIFHKRKVNNIYLDSINLENYVENISGNSERIKIRIRWYGNMFGIIRKPILELKIKNNDLGKKLSFPLKEFVLDKNFSKELLQEVFANSNLPDWLIENLRLHQPTILNSYNREYFISSNKKYRITLDKEFHFFKIGIKNNSFYDSIKIKDRYILELKYQIEDEEGAKEITKYFPFRLVANSKYVHGIELLEY